MPWQPRSIAKIDEITAGDHHHITPEDQCYFIGEYTARTCAGYSPTNQFFFNYKKPVTRRNQHDYHYKNSAIMDAAQALNSTISAEDLQRITFVPVPPSKTQGHPEFDNRLVETLEQLRQLCPQCDYQNIISQTIDMQSAHLAEEGNRPSPDDLFQAYQLANPLPPVRDTLAIFDDVLTAGVHFVAMRQKLREVFPNNHIIGIFLTRRKFFNDER